MNRYTLPLLILFSATCISARAQKVNTDDSLALVSFYDSTNGVSWTKNTNWVTTSPVSSWYGVTVQGNRVTRLVLNKNNLSGNIPANIHKLSALTNLTLFTNNISGNIPATIGNITTLDTLRMAQNKLAGSIPSTFGNLVNMRYLVIGTNLLTGDIPASLGNLDSLRVLGFSDNRLTGNIPSSLGHLTNLSVLSLSYNFLTGSIPASLSNLTNLTTLDLTRNQLSDSIPASLANLINLQGLYLDYNHFTFAGLEPLIQKLKFVSYSQQADIILHKNNNILSVSVGGTAAKNTYKWYRNDTLLLTKTGDSTFNVLQLGEYKVVVTNAVAINLSLSGALTIMDASDYSILLKFYDSTNGAGWANGLGWITNPLISSWYGVTLKNGRVTALKLPGRSLSGRLPSFLNKLSKLQYLVLNDNALTGEIPASFGDLQDLAELNLSKNQLSGTIPAALSKLVNLTSLNLNACGLSGSIPAALGNLPNLTNLQIFHNSLSDAIPTALGNLTKLTYLDLDANRLTGNIPASFGNLINLVHFDLSFNLLTGQIPSSLGNLPNLDYFALSTNKLSGSIPSSLTGLKKLSQFMIDDNAFTFDGMEALPKASVYLFYSFQASIPLNRHGSLLAVSAGGTLSNNTYKWYKNGVMVSTKTGDSTYAITGEGNYVVNVTNAIATKLVLTSDNYVLPLALITFTGNLQNSNVALHWQTESEVNVKEFVIERSYDAVHFKDIGNIAAHNLPGTQQYSFNDDVKQQTQVLYYRLVIKDKDEKVTYSNVLPVSFGRQKFNISLYPNPAQDKAVIYFKTDAAEKYTITISGINGQLIKQVSQTSSTGINSVIFSIKSYPAGVYFARFSNENEVHTLKFIKK